MPLPNIFSRIIVLLLQLRIILHTQTAFQGWYFLTLVLIGKGIQLYFVFSFIKRILVALSWITWRIRIFPENVVLFELFFYFHNFRTYPYFWLVLFWNLRSKKVRFKNVLIFRVLLFIFYWDFLAETVLLRFEPV